MALKLKEFDFKGFLLEKGERVGLYAAGGIAFLMVVLSLFYPGKGLLSPSPKKSADDIIKVAGDKKTLVAQAKPGASEAEELRKVPGELQKQAGNVAEDPEQFRLVAELFAPREIPSNKRQAPTIFGPDEFAAAFVAAEISSYMLLNDRDGVRVGIVEGSGRDVKGKNPFDRMDNLFGPKGGGGPGKPGGGMPFPPGGGMPGSGFDQRNRGNGNHFGGMPGSGGGMPPPGGGAPFGDDKKNLQITYVLKKELEGKPNPVFARDLMPMPMAYVVGSFPLKAQIEEFKTALRAESAYNVVFQETVGDKDKSKKAFDFLGFKVKRRAYGPDGKVILGLDGKDWQDLDLESPNSAYISTVAQVLKDFAPEDPKVAPLLVHGLYLPRPVQIPVKEGQNAVAKAYPEVEKELPHIQKTLEKMKEKETGPALPPSKLDDGAFNPFGDPEAEKANNPGEGKMPAAAEWAPPEYCVLRFLDMTIQPGQTYEYQVQVRMQNPNYLKPESEVANKQLTVHKELVSEWYPVKQGPNGPMLRVSVPQDLFLYAVDQQAIDNEGKTKKEYKGMNANVSYLASQHVPLQIHRWMKIYELSGKETKFYPVGDWVVGERVFATRGELVGVKSVQTHVPIWSPEQSQFTLAGRPPPLAGRGADTRPTEPVTFIEPRKAPLLVDFEAGTLSYRHAAAPAPKNEDGTPVDGFKPPPTTRVRSPVGTELLMLTPDGRLIGRAAARDDSDPARKARDEEYTKRVADAEGKETTPAAGGKPDPFGGGKPQ